MIIHVSAIQVGFPGLACPSAEVRPPAPGRGPRDPIDAVVDGDQLRCDGDHALGAGGDRRRGLLHGHRIPHGNQVWETNGTAAGTVRLSDGHDVNGVNGGIFPSDLTVVGNEVFFSASDFSHGYQIWETNGTAAGTQMVSDIAPG